MKSYIFIIISSSEPAQYRSAPSTTHSVQTASKVKNGKQSGANGTFIGKGVMTYTNDDRSEGDMKKSGASIIRAGAAMWNSLFAGNKKTRSIEQFDNPVRRQSI